MAARMSRFCFWVKTTLLVRVIKGRKRVSSVLDAFAGLIEGAVKSGDLLRRSVMPVLTVHKVRLRPAFGRLLASHHF